MATTDPNALSTVFQPTLVINTIAIPDIKGFNNQSGGQSNDSSKAGQDVANVAGALVPYAEIDNYRIMMRDFISLNIYQNGFLPEITLSFIDKSGAFSGRYFPRRNPLLKLYVKSNNPETKMIRGDYLVESIVGSPTNNTYTGSNQENIYTITGSLFIPGLYGDTIKALPKLKSIDALKKIATDLKLGFATNEESTNDEMTWINPNSTVANFIKNITDRAYKNETSFFTSFIDVNYILNFINVEKVLGAETKVFQYAVAGDVTSQTNLSNLDATTTTDNKEKNYQFFDVELNSSRKRSGSALNIVEYSMYSNHGEVLSTQAYKKQINWHDRAEYLNTGKYLSFYHEPLSKREVVNNQVLYQKPMLNNFTEGEQSARWLGIDYNNGHTNYKFAKLLNLHNLTELTKNYLVVKIPSMNQNVIRGVKVRVVIKNLKSADDPRNMQTDDNIKEVPGAEATTQESYDYYLSGLYYVKDVIYEYDALSELDNTKMSTTLVLAKREWLDVKPDSYLETERLKNINA
jgi:hypothetical protein